MAYTYNLIVGMGADGIPLVWQWASGNAIAIVGMGGSGKTVNTSYWLTQWACQGVRFLMADPHMDNQQSLYAYTEHIRDAFIDDCVRDHADITRYINHIHTLGQKRIRGDEECYPLVLIIDEFTSYILNGGDTAKRAALALLDSVNQYRKAQIRVMLIGQSWGNALQKITDLRDSISDAIVHKSAKNNALKFCAMSRTAETAKLLRPGQVYFQDELCYVPMLTATDKLIAAERVERYSYAPAVLPAQNYTLYPNETLLTYGNTLTQ